MAEDDLARVRELRARGRTPKAIARALGMRPSEVAPLIRAAAAAEQADAPGPELAECWVSPGWSSELIVDMRADWTDVETPSLSSSGLASVVVARRARHGKLSACGYLVDTHCLGVKDVLVPKVMDELTLHRLKATFFDKFGGAPLQAPLDLAQHLVLGAIDYARGLGFEPHPDFEAARAHLGAWRGPSRITFGRDGKPFYMEGPYDDTTAVLRTLDRTAGKGNYHFFVGVGASA